MSENKGYTTANDLQKWINHLTDEEKELPLIASEKAFPKPSEFLELQSIGHFCSSMYDGFVIIVRKNYEAIHQERWDND